MSAIEIKPVQTVTYEVNGKVFKTEDEAVQYQESLKNLERGLAFATAQYPELAPRGRQAKANVISEYLDWVEAGEPVKELPEESAE